MASNIRRIQKDIRECQATDGIWASPRGEKINELWATIRFTLTLPDKPLQQLNMPALIILNQDYPISAPSVGFPVSFPYSMGSSYTGTNEFAGMTLLCLNILSSYHNQQHTEGEGWSPSMSLAAVLLQLQSILLDLDAEQHPSTKKDLIHRLEQFKKMNPKCFLSEEEDDSPKVSSEIKKEQDLRTLLCSITGLNQSETVMGYGVSEERGSLRTPGEALSLVAYRNGIRVSSTNSAFRYFLPLQGPGEEWIKEAERSCAGIMSTMSTVKRSCAITDPVVVVYGKLLNGILVSMVTGEITDSERFIEAFVRLRETLRILILTNASRSQHVHRVIHDFIDDSYNRLKDKVPDVGELLAIYSCFSTTSTETGRFYDAFIDECTVRWVFWLVKNKIKLVNEHVFKATEFSRNLCLFQTLCFHTLEQHSNFQDCIQALDALQKNWREKKASVVSLETFLNSLPCTQKMKTNICGDIDGWITRIHCRARDRGDAYYPSTGGYQRKSCR